MTHRYYILESDHTIRGTDNVREWAEFHENMQRRRVAHDLLENGKRVSTVFLGIGLDSPSNLFETMIFPNPTNYLDEFCVHSSTWDEAVENHKRAVAIAQRESIP